MALAIELALYCTRTSGKRLQCSSRAFPVTNVSASRKARVAFCFQEANLSLLTESREESPPTESIQELSDLQLLWRAVKLPIYSVALIPLSVGSATAFLESGAFDGGQYSLLLVSSVLVITWLNLSNDAFDADTGVDKNKKESVVNITGSQRGVLLASVACLAFGCAGLLRAALVASDIRVASLLAAAISCGYIYQCPPFRLSYKGLGEPLCFLAFGPFATTAFYLSQSHKAILPLTPTLWGASALVGITTTLILLCSHFHQIEDDKAVGKISPLVRLGTENGSKVVTFLVTGLYTGLCALAALKALPLPCAALCLLTLPVGKMVVDFVSSNHHDKKKIFLAKYFCVRLHIAFGSALVLGMLLRAWR
ncbi:2-carboxy-1,4-naphthoquinone phytyltransferase, chloroplastic [Selaginella moellendorffii]|nr:2-carboxy-1,4-naphthoquinone phytyltransferase, chloroplastic [Selaginella moellendorffii]|eukprot:XP_002961856.2 2-carboxy-1,4-naphthoquinone phytyltransferase, chloroplastic [Selaginella moellendorffii]